MIKLFNSDCLKVDLSKWYGKVDLILFDPPFLPMVKAYSQNKRKKEIIHKLDPISTPENFMDWWEAILKEAKLLLKESGYFVFKIDTYGSKELYPLTKKYFDFDKDVIWDKINIGMGYYIRNQHEILSVYMANRKNRFWKYKELAVESMKGERKSVREGGKGTMKAFPTILRVLSFRNGMFGKYKHEHINQTPLEVWKPFIDYLSPKRGLIIDFTMGSGSVGMTAKKMGRSYIGIELSESFFKIAEKNIKETKYELKKQMFLLNES